MTSHDRSSVSNVRLIHCSIYDKALNNRLKCCMAINEILCIVQNIVWIWAIYFVSSSRDSIDKISIICHHIQSWHLSTTHVPDFTTGNQNSGHSSDVCILFASENMARVGYHVINFMRCGYLITHPWHHNTSGLAKPCWNYGIYE